MVPAEQQPLCISFLNGQTPFELKPSLIHLLPTFHGLPSENPHKHLNKFHMVCSSMKPHGVSEDQIKLCAFPFSLADVAKDWLFYLPSNSITTWVDMTHLFLDRIFHAAKASELRRSILGIRKKDGESLYDYWERFKKLFASCPQHGLTEQTLLQYFYEGKVGTARACGICTMPDHPTDCCPMLQGDDHAQTVGRLESQGKLPSQTKANPRENISAITLRSGTVIEPIPRKAASTSNKKEGEEKLKPKEDQESDAKEKEERKEKSKKEEGVDAQERKQGKSQSSLTISPYATPPPFPSRLVKRDKQAEEKEILDIFRKVGINIPLLDVIRKMPRYARFLKDLCTTKRKLTGNEKVNLGENVSAVFQRKLPPKLKDQADFYVIDMENDRTNTSPKIILGRPFLSTSHTKIDANSGILTMEFMLGPTTYINAQRKNKIVDPPKIHARKSDPGGRDAKLT
ncbi:hypothetical protein V6N11_058289 [Hibiscus sabdariffa]|uniref:Retrotransposon gag domain-containing protein n=1 Tax=Hibiscus sabdariffa TaxID=183260 RepID=A0ABR2U3V0_9ROSI